MGLCNILDEDTWSIRLDNGPKTKWAISAWDRFWIDSDEDDALAVVVHELGHVFRIPHSDEPGWVMTGDHQGTGKLGRSEKENYRAQFIAGNI